MPSIFIENFQLANVGQEGSKIAQNESTFSEWIRNDESVLALQEGFGLVEPDAVQESARSIYWYNREGNLGEGYWLEWTGDVDAVKGPIADDEHKRLYWTGDGPPKMGTLSLIQSGSSQYPGASRMLGLPVPGFMTATGPDTEPYEDTDDDNNPITVDPTDGNQIVTTAYVITYVSDIGEEGPASSPTNIIDRYDGGAVTLTNIPTPSGAFNVTGKRIYRAELNGSYQFVAEISASTTTYSDNIESAALGEPLPSDGWVQPHENMIGLTALPNGVLAGFWKNTVAFSEPYQPHAWPVEYRYAMEYDVVGLAVCAAGLVVCTKGAPYIMSGSSPASMSQNKLEVNYPCLSKQSVVDMGDYVVYASTDGLVAVGGDSASLISIDKISRRYWRLYFGGSSTPIIGVKWRERYLGLVQQGSSRIMFSFHPREGLCFFNFNDEYMDEPTTLWRDPETDVIYGLLDNDSGVYRWEYGSGVAAKWISKDFSMPPSQNYVCCKIRSEGAVDLDFSYRVGLNTKSITVINEKPFRLPAGERGNNCNFSIELYSGSVRSVQLSTSMSELV